MDVSATENFHKANKYSSTNTNTKKGYFPELKRKNIRDVIKEKDQDNEGDARHNFQSVPQRGTNAKVDSGRKSNGHSKLNSKTSSVLNSHRKKDSNMNSGRNSKSKMSSDFM